MNSLIEWLNVWGGRSVDFALPILWQSSLLIAVIFAVDFLLRRKVRAAVRYSLWFVVFVKLLSPPTLALPTGAAWWLRSRPTPMVVTHTRMMSVNYSEPVDDYVPPAESLAPVAPPAPKLSREAWMLLSAVAVSVLLALWVLLRWRQIARCVRRTTAANVEIAELLAEAHQLAGLRRNVTLRVTAEAMSPAVCGLFRPVILLPQSLIEKLTTSQLRAVLLHELIHLRRLDVWVNCVQTLLQIVYWWHPLLWIANARMRRVREEAVDDAVMCALSNEAEVYAPTLLEVAKLAFARPLASLGLVGILESRSALRHRIERLLNFTTPRRAGVSMVSVICLAAFTALAVPMGEPPARPAPAATDELATEKLIPYRTTVNTDVFVRNIQARAGGTLHATNDDLNEILVSIMDGFGVDCTGDRAIQFDPATGVLTTKNSPEALGVLDEVVKELNLKGGEHVLNPPHGLKQVLIEGQFYLVKQDQMAKLQLASQSSHRGGEMTPWWELSSTDTTNFRQQLNELGVTPMMSPRIQTSHGVTASMFMGDGTNNIQLECVPYVHDGVVNFTVLARTTGEYAPEGKSWPDIAGHTNCAIFSRITVTNGGAGILRAEQAGADHELIVLLSAKIVEPVAKKKTPMLGDLPGVGPLFRSPSNAPAAPPSDLYTYTFRLDLETLNKRLKKFAEVRQMTGITSNPAILTDFLASAGVDTYPARSFFYREENGRADLTLHTTQEELQKAAEALGLNWLTEQALNEGRSVDSQKLQEDSLGLGTAYTPVGYRYKTNFTADASVVAQLVQDSKLLYQIGKLDEAELKLQEALAKDPNNQAALYYLTLIKQSRTMKSDAIGNARARNVPGPDPQANTIVHTNAGRQRIYQKLNSIVFDKIAFTNLPLSEVALNLSSLTQRRDPDQQGVVFLMDRSRPKTNSKTGEAFTFDLGSVNIDLNPGLKNVRLVEVLEAITKSADHPINYAIVDYGIEFFSKGSEPMQLHTRTFRVDPNTFYMGLQNVTTNLFKNQASIQSNGGANNQNASVTQGRGLRYVGTNGFDPSTEIQIAVINLFAAAGVNLAAPKSVFFNDRQGTLTVRATDEDFALIQQAISRLNLAPPEVTVKVRFVEISDEDMFKPGFEWFFKMMATNGTNWPPGILTDPLFRTLLKNIDQRKGADLLNEGEVTTLSGRQANFQVIEIETNQATASSDQTTNTPFGTSLDVVANVGADGYTIQLTLIPTITERVEHPVSGDFVPAIQSGNGSLPLTGQLPIPRTRVRQMVANCTVWDGQTAVLLLEPYVAHRTNVVVFVTTTIIDASGNRKNSDDSLQFAQKAIPPQPAH